MQVNLVYIKLRALVHMALIHVTLVCSVWASDNNDNARPDRYIFWNGGALKARQAYEIEVIQNALDATLAQYGDYSLDLISDIYTPRRSFAHLEQGDLFNMKVSSRIQEGLSHKATLVDFPLYLGILGYRQLIIRKEDLAKFNRTHSDEQLRKYSAGQVRSWADVAIYRHNKFPVVESETFEALFPMLVAGRFDYIPLGAIEIQEAFANHKEKYPELMIAPNILFYYPLPARILINDPSGRLRQRLNDGFNKLTKNGGVEDSFKRYFEQAIETILLSDNRTLALKNPNLKKLCKPSKKIQSHSGSSSNMAKIFNRMDPCI
ncbi:MAG: hypothetical protein ACI93R_001895 [Flavobacteriales bacterium]|jgi:hypothetical protein